MKDKGIDVSIFRHEDARGVADLFFEIYGNDYPIKTVYNPEELIDAFEKMDNIPVVARTHEGRIVGYVAMFRSAPHQRLYEAGQGLVLPSFRNIGIAALMNKYLCDTLAKRFLIDAVFGEVVCHHTHMQRAWAAYGAIETAVEVDLMPASAYKKEKSASGRVSTLDMFRTYIPKHHKIYIPPIYSDVMRLIYASYDDTREFSTSSEKIPSSEQQTILNTQVFEFAGVARIAVHQAGFDFRFFQLTDTEFIIRYGTGIPFYDHEEKILDKYAFCFIDGPHDNDSVELETQFFADRSIIGSVIVTDDTWMYDHEKIVEQYLFSNGFKLLEKGNIKASYIKVS